MKILITLTSSLSVGQEYIDLTRSISQLLAKADFGIVYGGTEYGMMAELAISYKEAGGKELIGVMSKELKAVTKGYKAFSGLDKSIWTSSMSDRIQTMVNTADGYIILPGGYGTLEEMMSIIGGKANKLYDKPIIIYNHNGYYNELLAFFESMYKKEFSKIDLKEIVYICNSQNEIINYFQTYSKTLLPDKFI